MRSGMERETGKKVIPERLRHRQMTAESPPSRGLLLPSGACTVVSRHTRPLPPELPPPEIRGNSFLHMAHRDFIEYSSSLINCNTSRPWAFDFRPVRRKNQVWVNFLSSTYISSDINGNIVHICSLVFGSRTHSLILSLHHS
mmetsp:Transcript_16945/g.33732  ORF Transcript_16945/g.33732 Transcript_16945/m.33732 type:complete len:142 (-) Transcript_16945:109-534(-)